MVYEGGGGVEKVQKTVYVVYERPLRLYINSQKSTQKNFKICLRFMNVFDMYSQMMKKRKLLSTRVTFKISLIFMNVFIRLPA